MKPNKKHQNLKTFIIDLLREKAAPKFNGHKYSDEIQKLTDAFSKMWNHPNAEKIKNKVCFPTIKQNEVALGLKNWGQVQKSYKDPKEEEKFEGGEREDAQEGELLYPDKIQERKYDGETKDLFQDLFQDLL